MEKTRETNSFSRRSFIKGAAALTAAGALVGCSPQSDTMEDVPEVVVADEIFTGVCRCNCAGGCFLNIHVRDGQVVRTSAKDMPDTQYNRICSKGLTHSHRMYSDLRVKYPMKRIGERGNADAFERVSWDEAIDFVATKWKEITDAHGPGAVAVYWGSGQFGTANGCRNNDIWNRFINVTGAGMINRSVDIAHSHSFVPVLGWDVFFTQNEPTDFVNSKAFFVWGANPAISQAQSSHFILEAKEAGAKLVVIDPIFNTMAAKADIYVPVRSGTDGALALGMAKLMIDKGWMDTAFVKQWTSSPYLVKDADGLILKQSDLGVEIAEGATNLPIVIDADGNYGTVAEIADPALEGSLVVEGHAVKTIFTLILEELQKYDLATTSQITGVPEAQIEEITDLYVNGGPSNIYTAFGVNHYVNGHYNFFCLALLPALSGNIGKAGAAIGLNECSVYSGNPLSGKPEGAMGSQLNVTNVKMDEIVETGMFGNTPAVIKGCVFCGCNAMINGVDRNKTKSWLEKLDLIVSVDVTMNENALMADVILPAAHWFEEEDVFCLFAAHPYMLYQEKATEPLYESKTDFEIACTLATALGYGDYFSMTDSEFLQEWFDTDTARALGLTYEGLKEQKALRMVPNNPHIFAKDNAFMFGRINLYREAAAPEYNWGQEIDLSKEHIPYWEPPCEVRDDAELRAKFPFQMISDHSRFQTHCQWWEVDLLRELAGGEPTLKINPIDAAEYGIQNGDQVKVYNDRGYVVMTAYLNPGLQPGVLSAPKGWEQRHYIDGHFSNLTSAVVNPACTNVAFNDVVVAIEKL